MPWFSRSPNPEELHRQSAARLLRSLETRLPGPLTAYLAALNAGSPPETVFGEVGQFLAERYNRQQALIAELQNQLAACEGRANRLSQEIERLNAEPVRQQLKQIRTKADQLEGRLSLAECDLQTVQRAYKAEQMARQQEVAEQKAYIDRQNRIIAQQQLRLNGLLGETPAAITSGDKS